MISAHERPWVSVCGVGPDQGIPRVGPDDYLMGQLAANHLLDCGLQQFGYIGHTPHAGAARRELGFRHTIESARYAVNQYHASGPPAFQSRLQDWVPNRGFRRWVRSLPRPIGIATFYDLMGLRLSETCREEGLRVPEDVAIVGMGNDDLVCELARPSLSSVDVPTEQIGIRAAALLDRLMDGSPPPGAPILIPPVGIVARQSSDLLAGEDADVVAALRLIREKGHALIQVRDILRVVPVSRRSLERKFRKVLNRGISGEIRRSRLERAKNLLASTELMMPAIAESTGFSDARHLSTVFRQATGLTPTAYRAQFRGRTERGCQPV
jgi:LacI family transcriptional regulator